MSITEESRNNNERVKFAGGMAYASMDYFMPENFGSDAEYPVLTAGDKS